MKFRVLDDIEEVNAMKIPHNAEMKTNLFLMTSLKFWFNIKLTYTPYIDGKKTVKFPRTANL